MVLTSAKVFLPKHIEYVIIDCHFTIIDYSEKFIRFLEEPDFLKKGVDIRKVLPELLGYEAILNDVYQEKQVDYSLKAINRQINSESTIYFDLYIEKYNLADHQALIIFIEDVTQQINLEQILTQKFNEYSLIHESTSLLNQLAKSNYYYEQIITAMADALIVTTETGIIKAINQTTLDWLGYSQTELIERPITQILADPNLPLDEIQQYLLSQGDYLKNFEVSFQTKSNQLITLGLACSIIKRESEDSYDFVYLGRDITKIKRYQNKQITQYDISQILANSHNFTQAAPKIIKTICEHFSWVWGEFWLPYSNDLINLEKNQLLHCKTTWIQSDLIKNSTEISNLKTITQQLLLQIGEGIAGQVWQNQLFYCVDNLAEIIEPQRQNLALEIGLVAGFSMPIINDGLVLGVMNFFSQQTIEPDQELQQMFLTIGNQIGQFLQRQKAELALRQQQQQTESLLRNILPDLIVKRLQTQQSTIADNFAAVSVLFADLVNFTEWFNLLPPTEVVEILNEIFSEFDRLSEQFGLEKIKTIGDAYLVVGGLPQLSHNHAEAIAEMALAMQKAIAQFNAETDKTLSLRIGINTGEVVAGIIGTKKFTYDLWGDAVNIARRMESQGIPDTIQVSATTYELLKDKYYFQTRGLINVKGKGEMKTYLLTGKK
ncbi:adenylate cyclase [Stanieria sp. NIES-3757]|nr:adenylate cyclase [Stanieria sp. NIES-3757]